MVMVLFALSEAIEARTTEHAKNAIQKLLATAPETATVRQDDGSWKSVDIHSVPVGSTVRVRPGEKVPLGRHRDRRLFFREPGPRYGREHAGRKEGR